jgi:hypothetical protein
MIAEAWVLGDGSGSRARHAERPTHPFSGPWTVPRDRGGDVARLAAVVSRTCAGSAHERNRERRIEMLTRRPRSAKSQIERKKAHVFCRRSLHLLKARKVLLSLFVAALVSARIYKMGMAFIQIASNVQTPWSGEIDRYVLGSCTLAAMCCKNDPQQEVTLVKIERTPLPTLPGARLASRRLGAWAASVSSLRTFESIWCSLQIIG